MCRAFACALYGLLQSMLVDATLVKLISGLEERKVFLDELWLFGSRARGDHTITSG